MSQLSDLDIAVARAISSVPECLFAGYVDVASGLLLSIKTVETHPNEVVDLVAAATADLFQGQNVSTVEMIMKKARGIESTRRYIQEIIVNSENLYHIFIRGKKYQEYVAVFACRTSANLGMVLTKSRAAVPIIESAV
jgi:hypothetical protein